MRERFGDYFLHKNHIYRTFTNYFEEGYLFGKTIYQVNTKNIISKIPIKSQNFKSVPLAQIDQILESTWPKQVSVEATYIEKKLKALGISNIELTGSKLLASYGYTKLQESPQSDLDFIIRGQKDSKILLENLQDLYDQNFISYQNALENLYLRRTETSKINTTIETIKNYELHKPIGIINGIHINLTPTYILRDYKKSDYFTNHGLVEIEAKIVNDSCAKCIPGYYEIEGKFNRFNISKLRSNVFYFCLGENLIRKTFKVKGQLISEFDKEKNDLDYVIELDSKWGVENLHMILVNTNKNDIK